MYLIYIGVIEGKLGMIETNQMKKTFNYVPPPGCMALDQNQKGTQNITILLRFLPAFAPFELSSGD